MTMFGGIRGSEVFKVTKLDSSRYWLRILAALVLALSIGSAGQKQPVQAAPARQSINWDMDVSNPKTTLCIGETVEYEVQVFYTDIGEPEPRWVVPGIVVDALSSNRSVGDFRVRRVVTGFTDINLETASFFFTATKPGNVKLTFKSTVDRQNPNFIVPVKVIPCKFKVIAASKWHLPGPHQFDIVAMIDNAVMEADAQGNFTGSASMNWAVATTVLSPICLSAIFTVSPSQANLTGQMDESGLLQANLTYSPATASVTQVCKVPTGTQTSTYHYQMVPDPLNLSVASSGGVFNQSQVLVMTSDFALSGSSAIVVIPEQGEAVAFNTNRRAALSPSAWRAMLWDNFPWSYSSLLALR